MTVPVPLWEPRSPPYQETEWTRKWEATWRSRWVEKYGKFYPKGVAPERMNNQPDPPPPLAAPRVPRFQAMTAPLSRWSPQLALATTWQPRKA